VVDQQTGISGCTITSEVTARQLYATFFVFAYVVPLTVIAICSVGILRHIKRRKAILQFVTEFSSRIMGLDSTVFLS